MTMSPFNFLRKWKYLLAVAFAFSVAIAIVCRSCDADEQSDNLVILNELSESDPVKADSLLKALPADSFYNNESDKMFYGLLRVKTANNIHQPLMDNTIFEVADYYSDRADNSRKREAYYYLGKRYAMGNDAPEALRCFQKALDASDDDTPASFVSKVCSQSGSLLLSQDLYEESLKMFMRSYRCDSLLKDTVNVVNSLRDIAQVYKYQKKWEKCESALRRAYALAESLRSTLLKQSVALVLSSAYYESGEPGKAHKVFVRDLLDVDEELKSPAYCLAVNIYDAIGMPDSANFYSDKLLTDATLPAKETALRTKLTHNVTAGDMAASRSLLKEYFLVADSMRSVNAVGAVSKIQALFNYSQKEKENARLRMELKNKEMAAIVVILVFLMLTFVLAYRNEHRKKKIVEFKRLNDHLTELYKEACGRLDSSSAPKACKQSDKQDDKAIGSLVSVYDVIKKAITKKSVLSHKEWIQVYGAVDSAYPEFKDKLYRMANLSEKEYRICILVKLKFRNNDIATLLLRSESSISMDRTKLYRKFFADGGTAKDFNSFILGL